MYTDLEYVLPGPLLVKVMYTNIRYAVTSYKQRNLNCSVLYIVYILDVENRFCTYLHIKFYLDVFLSRIYV